MGLADIVTVKLLPGGYFVEIAADDPGLSVESLMEYLVELKVPGLQTGAVEQAFAAARGKPCLIAALVAPSPPTQAPFPAINQRVIRWQKPAVRSNAPIKEARTILIVDMMSAMVKAFEAAFAGIKLDILHANLPNVFFAAITTRTPDLILLASQLGKIDGALLAVRIRVDARTTGVPVIMYSSPRPRQEIVRAFDAGITDYLVMPVDAQTYRTKINNSLMQVGKLIRLPVAAKKMESAQIVRFQPEAEEKREVEIPRLLDLIRKVKNVLAVPHILSRVLKIADDDTSGAKQLAQAIESDAATVAMVLRKANTVFYGSGQPITDVKDAVVRIGSNEIKALVLSLNAVKMFSKEQKSNGFSRIDYWQHTLATGIIARILGKQIRLPNADDLFVGGLLHDIGKIIFDEYVSPPFDEIVMQAINNRSPLRVEEKKVLGYSHVNVGEAILDAWKFPECFQVIVARHHHPEPLRKETCKEQHLIMARLVFIANLLTKALGVGSGGDLSIQELSNADWLYPLHGICFDDTVISRFHKELDEVGGFLEIGGALGEPVRRSRGQLPEVILIDPLKKVRVLSIINIHLCAMGYSVQHCGGIEEIGDLQADKQYAICALLEKIDTIRDFLAKLTWQLADLNFPVVIVLPESEKQPQNENGKAFPVERGLNRVPEQLNFLKDKQLVLFEPFDTDQLQNALEGH